MEVVLDDTDPIVGYFPRLLTPCPHEPDDCSGRNHKRALSTHPPSVMRRVVRIDVHVLVTDEY